MADRLEQLLRLRPDLLVCPRLIARVRDGVYASNWSLKQFGAGSPQCAGLPLPRTLGVRAMVPMGAP